MIIQIWKHCTHFIRYHAFNYTNEKQNFNSQASINIHWANGVTGHCRKQCKIKKDNKNLDIPPQAYYTLCGLVMRLHLNFLENHRAAPLNLDRSGESDFLVGLTSCVWQLLLSGRSRPLCHATARRTYGVKFRPWLSIWTLDTLVHFNLYFSWTALSQQFCCTLLHGFYSRCIAHPFAVYSIYLSVLGFYLSTHVNGHTPKVGQRHNFVCVILKQINRSFQWRIQDFSDESAYSRGGVSTYFLQFFAETAQTWIWKEFGLRGVSHPLRPLLDPPL